MYHDSLSRAASHVGEEKFSVQVEHLDEIVANDYAVLDTKVHDNDDDIVQSSPPVLKQPSRSIAADRPRRNVGPRKCFLVNV